MSKSWEQILGGYATDTLTDEEKHQLFEAALHDQELFDALADEEALKALLANSETRQRILAGLQASENLEKISSSPSQRLGWFRKPSSLAWVGSVAAMGLALIFGWQMEKDWAPIVQEEQEMERSVSQDEDHDNNEETFRSQASETVELKDKIQDLQKQDQSEPERVSGVSAPVPLPQRSSMAKVSKPLERMRQSSTQVRSKGLPRQEVKKERQLKANESVPQLPLSAIVQNVPEEEQRDTPSLASPEAVEKSFQQLPQSPVFADKLDDRDAISSPGTKELLNVEKRPRVDALEEDLSGRRAQQFIGETASQSEKGLTAEVPGFQERQKVVKGYLQGHVRGIRYHFVRSAGAGKDEKIDITKFPGKWSEVRLSIESNISGHLYVLTSSEKGKWQGLRPGPANSRVLPDGAIQVEGYQSVNFALSQVTNVPGNSGVESITVLLSSNPLAGLDKWLGGRIDLEPSKERLIEPTTGDVFVIDADSNSSGPFRVEILLVE